jgi:hypothetical protein
MRKLRTEMHRRTLGNGYCARPVKMDCHFESICESCSFFVTTIEFPPPCNGNSIIARRQTGYVQHVYLAREQGMASSYCSITDRLPTCRTCRKSNPTRSWPKWGAWMEKVGGSPVDVGAPMANGTSVG